MTPGLPAAATRAAPPPLALPLTPGAYIKARRQAQRIDLAAVAELLTTQPPIPLRDRVEWLELLEADVVPAAAHTIDQLAAVFRFDRAVLEALADIARGEQRHPPRLCRICACSDRDACLERAGCGCAWAEPDLCTACVCAPHQPAAAA